jgi:hypothetical protein
MRARFLFAASVLLTLAPARLVAHPTHPNQAIAATTIAFLHVTDGEVRLELEIGPQDLPVFADLISDGARATPTPAQERFFYRGLTLEAGDDLLEGRVTVVEPRRRVNRDPVSGDPLPPGGPPGEPVTFVEVRYPLTSRPERFFLNPPPAKNGKPASIGLVVYHGAIPVNDFDFLGLPVTLDLDWTDPWRSRFSSSRLQRYYNSPLWVSLSVEPREVRVEVFFRPKAGVTLLNGPDPHGSDPAGTGQRVAEFLATKLRVTINGRPGAPTREKLQLLRQGLAKIEAVAGPEGLPPEATFVRVGLVYAVSARPTEVNLAWPGFGPGLSEVPLWVNTATTPVRLTPAQSSYSWKSLADPAGVLADPAQLPSTGSRYLPLASLTCAAVLVLWVLPGFRPFGRARVRVLGVAVLVVGTVALWPFGRASLGESTAPPPEPVTNEQGGRIVRCLLTDSYRAFDCRDEEAVYDTLAEVVTGELLREAYLSIRRALDAPNQVGRARVRGVELESAEVAPLPDGPGFRARCRWTVEVAVTHWGHTHVRTNQYEADLTVVPRDGRWKLAAITILDEKTVAQTGADRTGGGPEP